MTQMSHRLQQQALHITSPPGSNMSESKRPNLVLYTDATPNGLKASIALEELGLPYKTEHINIATNKQKEQWFLDINPNGRIPAMTDTFSDGKTIRLFESGGIFQYLVDEYDKDYKISFPKGTREYYQMTNWVFFQNAGLGPMQGQANHFVRYAPEKIEYGMNRYVNETRRPVRCARQASSVLGVWFYRGRPYFHRRHHYRRLGHLGSMGRRRDRRVSNSEEVGRDDEQQTRRQERL